MNEIKILFLAANPSNSQWLKLDEESREITNKIRSSDDDKLLVFKARWAARPDDILQALNEEKPQIVHFSGHGGGASGLLFHDDNKRSTLISSSALKLLFRTLKDNIKLVFLNACYTQVQADEIVKVIDCVIGMKSSVLDETSIKFAASFYRAIGFGRSVKNAFEQGLVAIALANLNEENIPILLTRDGVDPDEFYFTKEDTVHNFTKNSSKKAIRRKAPTSFLVTLKKKEVGEHLEKAESEIYQMNKASGDHFLTKDLPEIINNVGYKLSNISLIMADIDELTIINKIFGEEIGNQVLFTVLNILKEKSETEFVGRCGDDTYYIFLPGLDITQAKQIAKTLRLSIQKYEWRTIVNRLRVTCSFGISEIHDKEPVRDWIIRAACGMIFAKETGRNKVILGPDYLSSQESRILHHYYSGGSSSYYPFGSVSFPFE